LDRIDRELAEVAYAKHVMSEVKIARQSKQASDTTIQPQPKPSSCSTIDVLSQHLRGELSKQIPT